MWIKECLPGALLDFTALVGVFLQWIIVSLVVDGGSGDIGTRKTASLYLTFSTFVALFYRMYQSFLWLGNPNAPSESLLGLFWEIVNLTQLWGVSFCAARTWSLPEANPFHNNTFLHNNADSIFEMGLVQAGVGWAAAFPQTISERVVAWFAAYIGGVLATNMFIVSIVLENRAYWKRDDYVSVPPKMRASMQAWKVTLKT